MVLHPTILTFSLRYKCPSCTIMVAFSGITSQFYHKCNKTYIFVRDQQTNQLTSLLINNIHIL